MTCDIKSKGVLWLLPCSLSDYLLWRKLAAIGICVISNAMLAKAFAPEARIHVIDKLCACITPETHKTALDAMKLCQIDII